MVRVLCLHGQGTNAAIFRKQMEGVMATLPSDYEFSFFDGEQKCESAPEVQEFFSPPYLAWYNTPTVMKVAEAHRRIFDICVKYGPFEVVVGFSQGAALAASILLHQELQGEVPLFQAAIFIGWPIPFAHRLDVGIDVRQQFGISPSPPNPYGQPTEMPSYLRTDQAYLRNPIDLGDESQEREDSILYQMFHGTADAVRIRIPTGHVYGNHDKWYHHSKDLVDLCKQDVRSDLVHDHGHTIPRQYTEEICDLIESTVARVM